MKNIKTFLLTMCVCIFSYAAFAETMIVKDGSGVTRYIGVEGAGSSSDPFHTITGDFLNEIAKGNVAGHEIIQKFGRNSAVGTSFVPVSIGAIYETPQVSGATTIRIKSGGNANDTAAGSGAREITIQGLDETGALATESVATAGTSASSATTTTFLRVFRSWVSASGTYATASSGSHSADVVLENGAGGTDWGTISSTDFSRSQTEVGIYSVPLGKTAYLLSATISVDSTKSVDLIFFKREGILKTAAPYDAMRIVFELGGVSGEETIIPKAPLAVFPALTDIGFMAQVSSGTADVDVDFEILLVDN